MTPAATSTSATSAAASAATTQGDVQSCYSGEYLKERVREVVPLLVECYELALEEEPSLEGKILVGFTVVGKAGIGGVVESVDLSRGTTITHGGLLECVRESIHAVWIDVPDQERIIVHYPFHFSPARGLSNPP